MRSLSIHIATSTALNMHQRGMLKLRSSYNRFHACDFPVCLVLATAQKIEKYVALAGTCRFKSWTMLSEQPISTPRRTAQSVRRHSGGRTRFRFPAAIGRTNQSVVAVVAAISGAVVSRVSKCNSVKSSDDDPGYSRVYSSQKLMGTAKVVSFRGTGPKNKNYRIGMH